MPKDAKNRINISPETEVYFDAIWELRPILSEESQNALMNFGFTRLGLEPERTPIGSNGLCLDKLRSAKVINEIEAILQNPEATNAQRCFLVGRLGCVQVGYKEEEILEIIEKHNRWSDYLPRKTEYHVHKVLNKLQ
jgi:hypothetical protein